MKKPLFNEYEAYNDKGGELSTEIRKALDPIIKKWSGEGYSIKDIESIAIDNITMASSVERATSAMKLRIEKSRRSGGTRQTREV